MQSRRQSLIESAVNILAGIGISLLTQITIFPWFCIEIKFHDQLIISGIFTIVSLARSYLIRRYFNWKNHAKNKAITQ
jgi:hypothetical protein